MHDKKTKLTINLNIVDDLSNIKSTQKIKPGPVCLKPSKNS